MMESRVVSWPPCCVAEEVKAPPTFPWRAPRAQSSPAWSRKPLICDAIRPNLVPTPTMIAS